MADAPWDDKLKSFLKKTSSEFKRFSHDVKDEAQKLMTEVQDPERQRKLREGLLEVGTWARKAAEEVATVVEGGVKKAEVVIGKAQERVGEFVTPTPSAQPTPPSPPPQMDAAPPPAPKPAPSAAARKPKKTIGRKRGDGEG
jgi:hypothetical protein